MSLTISETKEALSDVSILKSLANGIDPITLSKLPKDHVCNQIEVARALWSCLSKLESVQSTETASSPKERLSRRKRVRERRPNCENAGKKWEDCDDQYLMTNYNPASVEALAKHLKRSELAIVCRAIYKGIETHHSDIAVKYNTFQRRFNPSRNDPEEPPDYES